VRPGMLRRLRAQTRHQYRSPQSPTRAPTSRRESPYGTHENPPTPRPSPPRRRCSLRSECHWTSESRKRSGARSAPSSQGRTTVAAAAVPCAGMARPCAAGSGWRGTCCSESTRPALSSRRACEQKEEVPDDGASSDDALGRAQSTSCLRAEDSLIFLNTGALGFV
jgi:hypothetical protein